MHGYLPAHQVLVDLLPLSHLLQHLFVQKVVAVNVMNAVALQMVHTLM
jgi:hypothetical protein